MFGASTAAGLTALEPSAHQAIVDGLCYAQASISPKYFYDSLGSELFEHITRLPAYYLTRTERRIMQDNAADIDIAIGPERTIIELGAGNCEKAHRLCRLIRPRCYVAVDISADFLAGAVADLRVACPGLDIRAVAADLTGEITLPPDIPNRRRLVFYPGSSIGNFDPPEALALLSRMRRLLDDDGALLIGVDLRKSVDILEEAYNDETGITAAFNLNILSHLNQLIGSNFNLRQWRHRAFFNSSQSRIEMHLEAATATVVQWPCGERRFAEGERIHTENSYKYRLEDFLDLLGRAGFPQADVWCDERDWFAVILATP
ncbi:MAG: L-histidine N(alpha)-methyltransferase [Betaproteobacteria bacterium]|nr:L-histidine N(alpha)-methyltransferase [Betaproteobacteria bacterium]